MTDHPTDEVSLRAWTDAELLAAWQRTDGEGAEAEWVLAEIERRDLDL